MAATGLIWRSNRTQQPFWESVMSNPFTKKNPFMSMWLSGANRIAGTGRGLWQAAARKQQAAMIREAGKNATSFWTGALKTPSSNKRRKSPK
jgi:hypothetical protein